MDKKTKKFIKFCTKILDFIMRGGKDFMNIDLEINLLLDDINEYINSTLLYLNSPSSNLEVNELIMYLSSVDEIIVTIKKLLLERK